MTIAGTPVLSRFIPSRTEPDVHDPQAHTPTIAKSADDRLSISSDDAGAKVLGFMICIVSVGSRTDLISDSRLFQKGKTDTWPLNRKATLPPLGVDIGVMSGSNDASLPIGLCNIISDMKYTSQYHKLWFHYRFSL
jgi:hypothetical protein